MDVKPGYKRTDAGVIPADWNVRPLSSLAEKITVGIASAATHAYRLKGVPLFRNQNIRPGHLDDRDLLFVSPEYESSFKNKRLRGGDLLTARTGYPGTTCVVPDSYESSQSFTTLITRPKKREIDSVFLCHYVNSEQGQTFFEQGQIGGAQKNVNAGTLRQMPIPTPLMSEQKAIAAALSDIDAMLAGLGRLIAKKLDLKQAAMQQLLTGQIRLPGFQDDWEAKSLPELADIRSGGTPSTNDPAAWDGDIAWCTPTDITALAGRKYLTETARRITAHGLKQSSAEVIPAGSVVMTSRATIGECALNTVPMTTNQGFKNFVPFKFVDAEFLYYLLSTQKAGFISLCGGSTFLEIGKAQLRGYGVRLPAKKAEQTAIATVLSTIDVELMALEARREKTLALKQGMMQQLLTGRTRLV